MQIVINYTMAAAVQQHALLVILQFLIIMWQMKKGMAVFLQVNMLIIAILIESQYQHKVIMNAKHVTPDIH